MKWQKVLLIFLRKHSKKSLLTPLIIQIAFFLAVMFYIYRMWNFLLDDSYFGFNYAKNFADGYGFVFNEGEIIIGTSSPLMALIYSYLYKLTTISVITWAKVISSASLIVLSITTYKLFSRWIKNKPLSLVGVLLFILQPYVIFLFTHESLVYFTLALIGFYLWISDKKYVATFILGIGVLIRLEMVILWVILLSYELIKKNLGTKQVTTLAGLFTICWIWWFIFSYYYFDSLFSNSFYAKSIQTELGIRDFVRGFIIYNFDIIKTFKPSLIYFIGCFLLLFSFIKGLTRISFKAKEILVIISWIIGLTLFYIFTKMPFYHWFAIQIYFGIALIYVIGVNELLNTKDKLNTIKLTQKLLGLSLLITALVGISGLAFKQTEIVPDSKHKMYQDIGVWLNKNTTKDSSISYGEIGIIKYYSQRKIIDYIGMITPDVIPYLRKKDFHTIISKYKPDYFIYNEGFSPITGKLDEQEWFTNNYKVVKVFNSQDFPFDTYIYEKNLQE